MTFEMIFGECSDTSIARDLNACQIQGRLMKSMVGFVNFVSYMILKIFAGNLQYPVKMNCWVVAD